MLEFGEVLRLACEHFLLTETKKSVLKYFGRDYANK